MPIGGFVINIDPELKDNLLEQFALYPQVEIHGVDDDGNVVAVIDTVSSEEMEQITTILQKIDGVFTVGVTYFDAEDELEKIEKGEIQPTFSFGRKGEKQKGDS